MRKLIKDTLRMVRMHDFLRYECGIKKVLSRRQILECVKAVKIVKKYT